MTARRGRKLIGDKEGVHCPFPECPSNYSSSIKPSITLHQKYGGGKARGSIYRCLICDRTFSERRNTPWFQTHLTPEKVLAINECRRQGIKIRPAARLLGISRDTIARYYAILDATDGKPRRQCAGTDRRPRISEDEEEVTT